MTTENLNFMGTDITPVTDHVYVPCWVRQVACDKLANKV